MCKLIKNVSFYIPIIYVLYLYEDGMIKKVKIKYYGITFVNRNRFNEILNIMKL